MKGIPQTYPNNKKSQKFPKFSKSKATSLPYLPPIDLNKVPA